MLNFQIRSPGKVILHGEHAVVYQRPALAAVVGLATRLQFRSVADHGDSPEVRIRLEALNCSLEVKGAQFNSFLSNFRSKYPGAQLENKEALLTAVRSELAEQFATALSATPQQTHTQQALLSLHYLLAGAILSAPQPDLLLKDAFELRIDSELKIGAGLGSSASFGAALAAAFLIYAGHFDLTTYLEPQNQELISMWAFESERVMHGTPSGVDNTVCTYGGMLRFVKGQGFQSVAVQRPLNILLVDSRVARSTADVVANVRHLWETFPQVVDAIWDGCEKLVTAAVPLYESFGNGQDDSEKFEKLERLFQINNDLMKAVGVTHPKLEQIFAIAFKRGYFSKLTGAGSGGFAIVLLPEKYESNSVYWKLIEELKAAGFGVHATTAGGEGLRVEALPE